MKKGDATEIDHSRILFNSAIGIMTDIDKAFDNETKHLCGKDEVFEKARTLQVLSEYLHQMCLDEKDENEKDDYITLLKEIKGTLDCYFRR